MAFRSAAQKTREVHGCHRIFRLELACAADEQRAKQHAGGPPIVSISTVPTSLSSATGESNGAFPGVFSHGAEAEHHAGAVIAVAGQLIDPGQQRSLSTIACEAAISMPEAALC
jgi:hypothetical protein